MAIAKRLSRRGHFPDGCHGIQRDVCRLLAANRLERGESSVAGGTALNLLAGGTRISRDIDLFPDTAEALEAAWEADRRVLVAAGYEVRVIRERTSYVEALVSRSEGRVLMEWARDSAFRFFPLVAHDDFGLVLHPFDLATNKVLALVGRLEIRDWIDLLTCHERIQPLGYLVWAACGKDPGFSPPAILEQAGRTGRYAAADLAGLAFAGRTPDLPALSRAWHEALRDAAEIVARLPGERAGMCVLDAGGVLYRQPPERLRGDVEGGGVRFHAGSIRGALPRIADPER
jgi:hypothetical protein